MRSQEQLPRVAEIPFDSERKRMTTIHQVVAGSRAQTEGLSALHFAGDYVAFVKGAPDIILEYCDGYVEGDQVRALTPTKRQEILAANDAHGRARAAGAGCGLSFPGRGAG